MRISDWSSDVCSSDLSEQALQQFLDADVVVIGAPMYNFSIPSTLKAWIDRIAVPGRTFRYTEEGPEGLAGGKRVVIANDRGGLHANAPSDCQEQYMKYTFGLMGVRDHAFVHHKGLHPSPPHRNDI